MLTILPANAVFSSITISIFKCVCLFFQHLFARVQNVSWPEVGFLLSYCLGLMFFWVCLVLFCFLIFFFLVGALC